MTTDFRTGNLNLVLPPVELIPWPQLRELAVEHSHLLSDQREANAALRTLQGKRLSAQALDQRAFAEAIRAGNPEPKRTELDVTKQIGEAERRVAAIGHARSNVISEIASLIDEHRDEWHAELASRLEEAKQAYEANLRTLKTDRHTLRMLAATDRWLDQPEAAKTFNPVSGPVYGLVGQGGEPFHFDAVIAALEADLSKPTRPRGDAWHSFNQTQGEVTMPLSSGG